MSCLLLDNDDVRALLPVEDCVALVERAYADLDAGTAAGPPRTNLALPAGPGREYVLKCWQCADPRSGLAAVRLVSEVLEPFTFAGRVVGRTLPAGPDGGYVGLLLLFDITTGALAAAAHDSAIADLATAAAAGAAARHLARPDATVLALLGAGRQARLQLAAIAAVRRLAEVRVHYPRRDRRDRFCRDVADASSLAVRPVASAAEAMRGSDVVASASSSPVPVFEAAAVSPGMHVSLTRPSEAPGALYERADVLVTSGTERPVTHAAGGAGALWRQRAAFQPGPSSPVVPLSAVVAGRAPGRTAAEQVSVYGALAGYSPGILYAALGHELLTRARRAGAGTSLPSMSLFQGEPS